MIQKRGSTKRTTRQTFSANIYSIPIVNVKVPIIKLSSEFKKKFNQNPHSEINASGVFPLLQATNNDSFSSFAATRYPSNGFKSFIGTYKGRQLPLKVVYKHQGYLSLQELMKERIKAVSAKRAKKVEEDADKLIRLMMTQVVDIKVDVKSKERLILRLKRMSELRARKIWGKNASRTYYQKTRSLTNKKPEKQLVINY